MQLVLEVVIIPNLFEILNFLVRYLWSHLLFWNTSDNVASSNNLIDLQW